MEMHLCQPGMTQTSFHVLRAEDPSIPLQTMENTYALSIVVPTRNEAANIGELVRRLEPVVKSTRTEVIVVDDSDDDTPSLVTSLQGSTSFDLRLIHRPPGQREGGLGSAVVTGLGQARATWVCVMDADLQHPPEVIPALMMQAHHRRAEVVVATRYDAGGSAEDFGRFRGACSQFSTIAARLTVKGAGNVSDPMSGFFLVRKDAIDLAALRPQGFKILLEILGRTPGLAVSEVPFAFGTRYAGESKASLREGLRFLRLLLGLRLGDHWETFLRFGLVGLSGLLVNLLLLAAETELLGMFYLLSAIVAAEASTAWNFALTERWVFDGDGGAQNRARRCASFFLMNNAALVLTIPFLFALTSIVGIPYLLSNLIVIAILMVTRFAASRHLIWGRRPRHRVLGLSQAELV